MTGGRHTPSTYIYVAAAVIECTRYSDMECSFRMG